MIIFYVSNSLKSSFYTFLKRALYITFKPFLPCFPSGGRGDPDDMLVDSETFGQVSGLCHLPAVPEPGETPRHHGGGHHQHAQPGQNFIRIPWMIFVVVRTQRLTHQKLELRQVNPETFYIT